MEDDITKELIQGFIVGLVLLVPLWKIHAKAGLSRYLSLIALIPWFGLVISPLVLALSSWSDPIKNKIEDKNNGLG